MAYGGVAWNVHEVADQLTEEGKIQEVIIVGVDHAGVHRFSEYMPQKPVEAMPTGLSGHLK